MWIASIVLTVAALPFTAAALYLAILAVLARRSVACADVPPNVRFDIIVPAHNEEVEIADTVQSLRALDYPAAEYRIFVIADNCTDTTAERAAAAGAHVRVRSDADLRGKGHALAYAFEHSLAQPFAEVIVVVEDR